MKKRLFSYLKICLILLFALMCGYFLLVKSNVVAQGIKKGLTTVGGVLIPSLFPFMVLACFMENSGVSSYLGKILSPVTRFVFHLPGETATAVFMSFIGGFPVGAKMTEDLLNKGKITSSEASRMYLFCVNAGPAFTVSTVGVSLLGSVKAGVIIFCSLTLSSLIIGAVSGFIFSASSEKSEKTMQSQIELSVFSAFTKSTSQATHSMLSVCSYVIVFSALCEGIKALELSGNTNCLLFSVLEVTNGVLSACGEFPLPVITAIIGFGGICVHFQVMSGVVECNMKIRHFLVARLINALLSSGICRVLIYLFPIEISVFAPGKNTPVAPFGVSLPCCIAFFIMSISLVFDIAPKKKV